MFRPRSVILSSRLFLLHSLSHHGSQARAIIVPCATTHAVRGYADWMKKMGGMIGLGGKSEEAKENDDDGKEFTVAKYLGIFGKLDMLHK
jgi:hypothetical protein